MKATLNFALLGFILTCSIGQAQQCATRSVLQNIDCGGGQATCFAQKTAQSGAVRCTCTASCASPSSIDQTVGATKALQWGVYVDGVACQGFVTGQASGGTQAGNTPSINSAVFAQVTVSAAYVANRSSSKQVVDCFGGTIQNDDDIQGVC